VPLLCFTSGNGQCPVIGHQVFPPRKQSKGARRHPRRCGTPRLGGSGQGGQLGGNWVRMSSEGNEFCVEERSALERPRLPPVPIAPELLGARSAKVGQIDETHDASVGRRDEPIHLRPYDTRWPVLFKQEAAALRALIAPWITGGIHHVGSTAIPGLAAKPSLRTMRRSSASLREASPRPGGVHGWQGGAGSTTHRRRPRLARQPPVAQLAGHQARVRAAGSPTISDLRGGVRPST
jgi:hypothetical protein